MLDQAIGELGLMHTDFLVLPPETTVAEALRQCDPGQIIVVANNESSPAGLLLETTLSQLPNPQRPLAMCQAQIFLPTLTSSDTRLSDVLRGMVFDRSIRWHAVLTSGRISRS